MYSSDYESSPVSNSNLAIDPFPDPLLYHKILAHFHVTATILIGKTNRVNAKRIFLQRNM